MLFLGGCALMASVFVLLVRVVPAPGTSATAWPAVRLKRNTGDS
jgi:hypothetical protein